MENLLLPTQIKDKITWLSEHQNTSELEVLTQALDWYIEKIKKQELLLSFAGILTEEAANSYQKTIQNNRQNKNLNTW